MNESDYKKAFGIDPPQPDVQKNALEYALEIRKFEIDLYWKRATYFWTLIASAFAGYFVIMGTQHMAEQKFMAFIVACVGFLFTFAWLQVNRGSKQWQENWENHVDMLEDAVAGPLYKTVLRRPPHGDGLFERSITGPASISVSKTNQIVNLFTLFIWLVLAYFALDAVGPCYPFSIRHLVVAGTTAVFCIVILSNGKTHHGEHIHHATLRKTGIAPKA